MDPHTWPRKSRTTSTNVHSAACEDTICPEDLPRAMNDREEWRERVRDIRAASAIDDDDDILIIYNLIVSNNYFFLITHFFPNFYGFYN